MRNTSGIGLALMIAVVMMLAVGLVRGGEPIQAEGTNLSGQSVQAIGQALRYTQTYTSVATYQPNYALLDCYTVVGISGTNTVTVKLQHSVDKTNWVDLATFDPVTVNNTIIFTRLLQYGAYMRTIVAPTVSSNTVPITTIVTCMYRNQ